ncbi:MAG: L-2-hydroxyglutarate oxidase [Solirubrobacterales bacterium]
MSEAPPRSCDVVVVGAGIVGLAVARELSLRHDGIRVAVIEAEDAIGRHQTGHSSGVIHAGVYYAPGSLKAKLCVAGAAELYDYCDQRGIEAQRSGKLIVATRPEELERLDELERRATANAVPGLRRLAAAEIPAVEPHAVGIAALHSPATGTVDFSEVAAAFAADLATAGGSLTTRCRVTAITERGDAAAIAHSGGMTEARAVAVCAGAWSDRVASASGAPADPRIVPFRGAYLRLRPERSELVRANVYPVPDPELPFLGAHLTRAHDGGVLLGPSALIVGARDAYRLSRLSPRDLRDTLAWPGTWRMIRRHWRTGALELRRAVSKRSFVAEARRLVPELRAEDFIAGPVGVRAQAVARDGSLIDDFIVSETGRAVHVRNAPSPAATSALPLARLIADRLGPLLD